MQKGIHKGAPAGRIQAQRQALDKSIREDQLSDCLRKRPTLAEVMSSGILTHLHFDVDAASPKAKLKRAMAQSILTTMLTSKPRSRNVVRNLEKKALEGRGAAKRMGHMLVQANKEGRLEGAVAGAEHPAPPKQGRSFAGAKKMGKMLVQANKDGRLEHAVEDMDYANAKERVKRRQSVSCKVADS